MQFVCCIPSLIRGHTLRTAWQLWRRQSIVHRHHVAAAAAIHVRQRVLCLAQSWWAWRAVWIQRREGHWIASAADWASRVLSLRRSIDVWRAIVLTGMQHRKRQQRADVWARMWRLARSFRGWLSRLKWRRALFTWFKRRQLEQITVIWSAWTALTDARTERWAAITPIVFRRQRARYLKQYWIAWRERQVQQRRHQLVWAIMARVRLRRVLWYAFCRWVRWAHQQTMHIAAMAALVTRRQALVVFRCFRAWATLTRHVHQVAAIGEDVVQHLARAWLHRMWVSWRHRFVRTQTQQASLLAFHVARAMTIRARLWAHWRHRFKFRRQVLALKQARLRRSVAVHWRGWRTRWLQRTVQRGGAVRVVSVFILQVTQMAWQCWLQLTTLKRLETTVAIAHRRRCMDVAWHCWLRAYRLHQEMDQIVRVWHRASIRRRTRIAFYVRLVIVAKPYLCLYLDLFSILCGSCVWF
jgi:hypothetical protein